MTDHRYSDLEIAALTCATSCLTRCLKDCSNA